MPRSPRSFSACGEMPDRAFYPIAVAVGLDRVNLVVVGCPSLEVLHPHAENRVRMARVQPDWRFRCMAEFLGADAVIHHSVMLGRAAWIAGRPRDNRKIRVGPFELWALGNPGPCGFLSRGAHLRGQRG